MLKSGMPNFLAVALALQSCGYKPMGIRIDSGDLSYLSLRARELMQHTQDLLGVGFIQHSPPRFVNPPCHRLFPPSRTINV